MSDNQVTKKATLPLIPYNTSIIGSIISTGIPRAEGAQVTLQDKLEANPSYDTRHFRTEYPAYPLFISAKPSLYPKYKPNDSSLLDNTFIGSLPLSFPYRKDTSNVDECENPSKLVIPTICNEDSFLQFMSDLLGKLETPEGTKLTGKWKVIKSIEDLADEINNLNDDNYQELKTFLLNEYNVISTQIPQAVLDAFITTLTDYNREPIKDKLLDYEDLSAYKNADFPKLDLELTEENPEVKKLLDELDKLGLEDLNIPVVQIKPESVTERVIDGSGMFDQLSTALFNQLLKLRKDNLITQNEVAEVYKAGLVQNIQVGMQFALEQANILNQSYAMKIQAAQASIAVLQAKAQMLMLPVQIRTAYAQLEAQLKQLELLKIQIALEKEKYPQVVAQTDLILAQTDAQRLQNEQIKVGIQGAELSLVQSQEQIQLIKEQNKQAIIQTELAQRDKEIKAEQIIQSKEQTKSMVLQNNKLIADTKATDAQTRGLLKDLKLKDSQLIMNKAQIKLMAQQLEKEVEGLLLIKAQTASAMAQLALFKDQKKASEAQYSDTIDGKPVGGLLGAQILVNKVQASSFERKAFNDIMTQVYSGWSSNKTADIAIASPVAYTPLVVDRVMQWGFEKYFNMPQDIMQVPYGYSPYLTDDEMDGKYSVDFATTESGSDPKKSKNTVTTNTEIVNTDGSYTPLNTNNNRPYRWSVAS